jgi:hypothetical protein
MNYFVKRNIKITLQFLVLIILIVGFVWTLALIIEKANEYKKTHFFECMDKIQNIEWCYVQFIQ